MSDKTLSGGNEPPVNPAPADWRQFLLQTDENLAPPAPTAEVSPPPVSISSDVAVNESEIETEKEFESDPDGLACGLCFRSFPAEELTIASKERFNWEASVVVCPECLTELRLEMRSRSKGPDLLLGLIWGVIGFVVCSLVISLAVWFARTDASSAYFWEWMGCYFAIVPGFIIGRFVRYGVGKRHSLEQQLIAVFFTFATSFITTYIGWVAVTNNTVDLSMQTTQHQVTFISPWLFFTIEYLPAFTNFTDFSNILIRVLICAGIAAGLVVAFLTSSGLRIYTRPYKK